MKNLFYSIALAAAAVMLLNSCSSGVYDANPSSVANQSINPLNPLKANQFTWSGSIPFSAVVNGALWVADTAWTYIDTSGAGNIEAVKYATDGVFLIHYPNSWGGNLYNMGYEQPRTALFADSVGGKYEVYYSVLGNSGELYLTKNVTDTLIGKFYFQGVGPDSTLVNITDGYIDLEVQP